MTVGKTCKTKTKKKSYQTTLSSLEIQSKMMLEQNVTSFCLHKLKYILFYDIVHFQLMQTNNIRDIRYYNTFVRLALCCWALFMYV